MKNAHRRAKELILAGVIPHISGPPGLGKSTLAQNIADELNLELRDIRLAQYQGTDLGGFPYVVDGVLKIAETGDEFFPLDTTPLPDGKDGWLVFLDELTLAEYDTLKVTLRVINERKLGKWNIHPAVKFMAASNPKGAGSMGNHLPDALVDRMATLYVDYEPSQWLSWAKSNGINEALIDIMFHHPVETENWGPGKPDMPFISPRALNQVSDYLNAGYKDEIVLLAICGPKFAEQANYLAAYQKMPDVLKQWESQIKSATPMTISYVLEQLGMDIGADELANCAEWLIAKTPATDGMLETVIQTLQQQPNDPDMASIRKL